MVNIPTKRRLAAFTIIELLVVIAILAVLAVILFPAAGAARSQIDTVKSTSQLRQIGGFFWIYVQDNDGESPPTLTVSEIGVRRTWRYYLMRIYHDSPLDTPQQRFAAVSSPDYPFWSPAYVREFGRTDHIQGYGSYSMNGHFQTVRRVQAYPGQGFGSTEPLVVEGSPANPSNTAVGVSTALFNMEPGSFGGTAAFHKNGMVNALFLDGHVRRLSREEQAELDAAVRALYNFD